ANLIFGVSISSEQVKASRPEYARHRDCGDRDQNLPAGLSVSCFTLHQETIALWHRRQEADNVRVYKSVPDFGGRRRSAAYLSRNDVKVQSCRPFDITEVVSKVIRICIETRINLFRRVIDSQFPGCLERNVHFAVFQLQSA